MYQGKIIDAHIHPFTDDTNESVNIAAYGVTKSEEEFFAELKKCGFSKVCGSVLRKGPATFEEIKGLNRTALALRDRHPEYVPGIHVHDEDAEGSCKELEEMYHIHKVRWIGELVDYALKTGIYNSPGMMKIYETARDLSMPVNIHCSDLTVIEDVLKNFPTLPLVIAHPEDLGTSRNRFALVAKYPNAYLDVSGTGLFRWGMLRYAVNICGSEKILFGSDFPICSPGMNLGGVLSEHLTDPELENILYKNFERLTQQ